MDKIYQQTISLIQQHELSRLGDTELESIVNYLIEFQNKGQIDKAFHIESSIPPKVVFDTLLYERARRLWDRPSPNPR